MTEKHESEELVKVCVRIRPEYDHSSCLEKIDDKNLKLIVPDLFTRRATNDIKIYSFDKIYDGTSSQSDIYKCVSENVAACTRGYNTTIFAYGCTGSGKSYTMAGTDTQPGIIPRALSEIFNIIETRTIEDPDIYFYVRMSYVELYNNNFRNLLESAGITKNIIKDLRDTYYKEEEMNPIYSGTDEVRSPLKSPLYSNTGKRDNKIEVREDKTNGVFLAGPNLRVPVTNQKEAYEMYRLADKHRSIGATNCNDVSSRSHAILTLHVESRTPNPLHPGLDDDLRLGKMHLIDLAGSERLSMSGAEGETLIETQNINLSLTTLGDVISALTKNAATMTEMMKANPTIAWHKKNRKSKLMASVNLQTGGPTLVPVPYRNSKLTHLLKDSLGGNSKTLMITTIRPSEEYYQQTAMSLMYASRAKKIRNQLLINKSVLGDSGIHAVNSELQRLKKRLEDRSNEFERLRLLHMKDTNENVSLKARLQELQAANEAEKLELENQMSHIIHNQAGQLVNQKEKIVSLQRSLQDEIQVSQNRIAEQEKEIKWLKRALKDKSHTDEELERMKQGMNDLQSQASNAREEVVVVLNQAEKLKLQNETLKTELNDVRSSLNSLQHKQLLESKEFHREISELNESTDSIKRQLEDAIKIRDKAVSQCEELSNQLTNSSATAQKLAAQQLELQEKNTKALIRINEIEKEKHDLQIKLTSLLGNNNTHSNNNANADANTNTFIGDIENRTSLALNGANERIKSLQSKLNTEEERALKSEKDAKTLKAKLTSAQDEYDKNVKSRDDLILKLKESILNEEEKSAELIRQMAKKDDSIEKAKKTCSDLANELQKSEKRVAEKVKIEYVENETLIKEQQRKIKEIQDQHVFLIAKALNEQKQEYDDRIKKLIKEFQEKNEESEADTIKQLEDKHKKAIDNIRKESMKREKDSISNATTLHENIIEQLKTSHNDQIFEIENIWKEKIKIIETNHAEAINQMAIHHRNQADNTIKSTIRESQKSKDNDIQKLKKEIETKYETLLERVLKEKEEIEQKYKEELEERFEIEKNMKNDINEYILKLQKSVDDNNNKRKELQNLKKELQSIKTEYKDYKYMNERSIKLEREEIHERHKLQIVNLEHEHENNLQEYIKTIESNDIKYKKNLEETTKQIQANHDKELDVMKEQMLAEFDKEKENLKEAHAINLDKQKRDITDKFDCELLKMLSAQEQALIQERENVIASLEAQYTDDLSEAKRVYDRQLTELMDAQERSLNAKYDAYHKEEEMRWNKVINEMKETSDREIERLTSSTSVSHQQELDLLKRHHKEEIDALSFSKKQDIDALFSSNKREIDTLSSTYKKEKDALDSEIINLRQTIASTLAMQDSVISKLNDSQKKELELLDKHSQEMKSLAILHKEELEKTNNNHEIRLSEEIGRAKKSVTENLDSKYKAIIDQLKVDHLAELERHGLLFQQTSADALTAREAELKSVHDSEVVTIETKFKEEISDFKQQLLDTEARHKQELEKALKDQHDELFTKHVADMENIHNEKRQIQLKHQMELTESMESKIAALNAQRVQLEAAHSQLVESLTKELSTAQERYRNALATAASKQGEEGKQLLEQQAEFTNILQSKLFERDSYHQMELDSMKSSYEKEVKKVDELSARLHEKELKELELARTLTLLTQNVEALNTSNNQLKEDMVSNENKLRDDLAKKLSNEIERHREELKQVHEQFEEDLLYKNQEIAGLESTIAFRNDEKDNLMISLSDAKESNDRLQEDNEKLHKEIETMKGIINSKDNDLVTKDQEFESLKNALKAEIFTLTNDSDVIKLKTERDSWIEKCAHTEETLASLETKKKEVESNCEQLKTCVAELQKELDTIHSKEKQHEETVENVLELRTSWWETEKGVLNDKIGSLTAELAEKISGSLEDANKYTELLATKNSLQKEVENLSMSIAELEAKIRKISKEDSDNSISNSSAIKKVPIRVLSSVNDNDDIRKNRESTLLLIDTKEPKVKTATSWTSPKQDASPSDQLTSAIIDGDVQGIRVIVRSMGEDFSSLYWKDKVGKLLPLHRAVSALHFHGNRKLLVSSLEALIQLGSQVNDKDSAGNTALHKVIQTCTSRSVILAVQTLINRSANPNISNNNGEFPLFIECCNLRTASEEVLSQLLRVGANPNITVNGFTPLSKVLSSGIQISAAELDNEKENMSFDDELREGVFEVDSNLYTSTVSSTFNDITISDYFDKMRLNATRNWLRVINALINGNALWDKTFRDENGCTQLHLLLMFFPPTIIQKDFNMFMVLLTSCLDAGISINIQDNFGRNSLFLVCERLQQMPITVCPDAEIILRVLLRYGNQPIDAYLNAKNQDNVSINDMLSDSNSNKQQRTCLWKCCQFLLNYSHDNTTYNMDYSKTPQTKNNVIANNNTNTNTKSRSRKNKKINRDNDIHGNISLDFTPEVDISTNNISIQSVGKAMTMSDILTDTKIDIKSNINSNMNTPVASSPLFRTAILYSKNKKYANSNTKDNSNGTSGKFLVESDDDDD